jgi:hypothetical protein
MGVQLVSFTTQLIRSQIATAKFCFPLWSQPGFVFRYGLFHSVFHYGYFSAMFYTMGQSAMFYTMG